MTDSTIDPKKLKEAKEFTAQVLDTSQDLAKQRQATANAISKFDKVAAKVRARLLQNNYMNEVRTYNPNGYVQENQQYSQQGHIQENIQWNGFGPDPRQNPRTQGYNPAPGYDPMLNEAYQTAPVQHPQNPSIIGVQKASHAVFAIPNSDGKTRYEVANINTQQKLIGELKLNETADAIVKLLNRNYSFYSPEVQSVLKLEESYSKHYNDMLSFKRKNKLEPLEEIHKVRFEDAKAKAIMIKEELTNFNKKLK